MAKLNIEANSMFTLDVTVRESDPYSESVYLKFERTYKPGKTSGCDTMFLTPTQLDLMGRFLIREAEEIRKAQEVSKK